MINSEIWYILINKYNYNFSNSLWESITTSFMGLSDFEAGYETQLLHNTLKYK